MKIFIKSPGVRFDELKDLIGTVYKKGLNFISVLLLSVSFIVPLTSCEFFFPPEDNKEEELLLLLGIWWLTRTVPDAPQNVVVLADDDSFRISWDPVDGATGYNIYWSDTGDASKSDIKIADVTRPYIHGPFAANTTHSYMVTAKNSVRESRGSTPVSATTGDLLTGSLSRLMATDPEAGDNFGYSVDMNDDFLVVGAPFESGSGGSDRGAVYVYRRTGTNSYGSGVKLTASDGVDGDQFGYSVSIAPGMIVVGAPYVNGGSYYGAAYVFRNTGSNTWTQEKKLISSNPAANEAFGYSVSISNLYAGDYYVIAGAPGKNSNAGVIYFFRRDSTGSWSSGVEKSSPTSTGNDQFGFSVGISGDYAAVGEIWDAAGGSKRGSVFVFHRTGINTWDSGVNIGSGSTDVDYFGSSVSISGDYLVAGAPSGASAGYAVVFHRTGTTTWDSGSSINPTGGAASDQIGFSVDVYGERISIGAPGSDGGSTDEGAAYMYTRSGTNSWGSEQILTASDPQNGDKLGFSVGVSSYGGVVCASLEDGGAGDPSADSGTCYY